MRGLLSFEVEATFIPFTMWEVLVPHPVVYIILVHLYKVILSRRAQPTSEQVNAFKLSYGQHSKLFAKIIAFQRYITGKKSLPQNLDLLGTMCH